MISVVFSTFNGERTLPRMLEALCRLQAPSGGFEVIAVDNGSDDASFEILKNHSERLPLKLLKQPKRGKNRALNLGLCEVQGDLIVLTDDDVVPDKDWLSKFEACAADNATASLFGGAILPHWEVEPASWLLNSVPLGVTYALTSTELKDGPIFPGLIWGANMMVRRHVFDAGHRFNEDVGPSAGQYIMGSETEFNLRIAKYGYSTWFCSDARVGHIIRDYQMTEDWVIRRGYRFGRNKYMQDFSSGTPVVSSFWGLAGFPKWVLRRALEDTLSGHVARLAGNKCASVARFWDAAFYRGYIFQAREFRRAEGGR